MPSLSTVPGAITALLEMFSNSPLIGGAGCDVIDAPAVTIEPTPQNPNPLPGNTSATQAVFVGWTSDPLSESAVEMKTVQEGLGAQRDREQYTIHCCAMVLNGDSDINAARTAAMGFSAAAREIIALNRSLNGQQLIARFGNGTLTAKQGPYGMQVFNDFDIEVDGYTSYQP